MTRPLTTAEIQTAFWNMVQNSPLAQGRTVYRAGYRPRNSESEDIVVTVTASNALYQDTGVVTIHVYVPDIDPYSDGTMHQDGTRTSNIERIAQNWIDSLTPFVQGYHIVQQDAVTTIPAHEINQHIVVIMLRYTYYDTIHNN